MNFKKWFDLNIALSFIVAFCAMGSPSAPAQENPDIAGTWDFTLESPQGKNTFLFIVKKDGEKLSGSGQVSSAASGLSIILRSPGMISPSP